MRIALYMWGMAGVLAAWPVAAQWREVKPEDEPALFRSDVNLVRVDAEVLLGSKALLGLKQKDFQVYDNGARREITHFSHENAPLDLLLIFDVSGSMRPVVEMVAESAQQALSQLRDGDRVGIMVSPRRAGWCSRSRRTSMQRWMRSRRRFCRSPSTGGTSFARGDRGCGAGVHAGEARRPAAGDRGGDGQPGATGHGAMTG